MKHSRLFVMDLSGVDSADLFQGQKKKRSADACADSRFRDRQIRRFKGDPYNTHDGTVGHKNDHCLQQVLIDIDCYGTDDQQ